MENSKAMPYFFIVKSGRFKQTLFTLHNKDLEFLNPGDTFGLIACLTGHNYINRLIAVKGSVVIMIEKKNIIDFLSSKQDIFFKIVSEYSNRLRKINQKLFSLCSNSIYTELPKHLLEIAEYYRKNKMMNHYFYALSRYQQYGKNAGLKEKTQEIIRKLIETDTVELQSPEIIGSHVIFDQGEIIFLEQEKGEYFYFIEKGKVKISHIDSENEFIVAILKEGEIFGEMAILNGLARNATAIAFEQTRLLILSKDNLFNELGVKLLQKLFSSFAKRIWYSYRRALNLYYSNPVARLYDCLDFIIKSKEAQKKDISYYFDISLTDLRVMTNTLHLKEDVIKEFLNDDNIQIHFGQLSITNITKFEDTLKLYLSRERRR